MESKFVDSTNRLLLKSVPPVYKLPRCTAKRIDHMDHVCAPQILQRTTEGLCKTGLCCYDAPNGTGRAIWLFHREGYMPEPIKSETINYKTNGDTASAYLVYPEVDHPHGAVVVIQEWWGLDDHVKDITERYARQGFVAAAPDLFHGRVATEPSDAQKLAQALDRDRAAKEIDALGKWLLEQDTVTGEKFGIVGFCMGGGLALSTAIRNSQVGACVNYYGGAPRPPESTENLQAPVLGFFGSDEAERAQALEDTLNQYGKQVEVHVYDGARHGFFNDTGDGYHQTAAYDTWPRAVHFLEHAIPH